MQNNKYLQLQKKVSTPRLRGVRGSAGRKAEQRGHPS